MMGKIREHKTIAEEEKARGEEEAFLPGSVEKKRLNDLGDDNLALVLSFLSPSEVGQCACVSRRLRGLCKDDSKVRTCVKRWGKGRVCLRVLHGVLLRWEKVIGFWRGIGNKGRGCLVDFEWGTHFILGFKVLPATCGSYGVCKIPFLWIGVSSDGSDLCFVDRHAYKDPCYSANEIMQSLRDAPVIQRDQFEKIGFDTETAVSMGLTMVNVHFIGINHLLMEEMHQQKLAGKRLSLAEAATVTSFGSSSQLGNNSHPSRVGGFEVYKSGCSPPGSFPYEMYHFLASKVTSAGGDTAERRQMRRDRMRALSQGKQLPEPEYFVKVLQCTPTKTRPLQGLWKGLCHCMSLDFILLSYDEQGGIVCRKIKECSGIASGGPVYWTARPPICSNVPLSPEEQGFYDNCLHVKPRILGKVPEMLGPGNLTNADHIDNFMAEEVVGMLHVTPDRDHCCFLSNITSEQCKEGRVWLYESGRFGYGVLHTNSITDFRLITSRGCLLDVVDK
ncbi:hypothetical protein O6H91_Y007000 [Diphasiastrum complanatum]|nr:hypothetical protein O6H91_Y007000 [Diphasiastrum complanatum]